MDVINIPRAQTHRKLESRRACVDEEYALALEITTRQLVKCEWNLELASNFF
jgi:hypothetical protein